MTLALLLALAAGACGGGSSSGGTGGTGGTGGATAGRGGQAGTAGTGGTGTAGTGGSGGMGGTSGSGGTGGTGVTGPPPDFLAPRDAVNVFMSGHSLINLDMPWNVGQLAMASGRTYRYNLQMGIGSTMGARLSGNGNEQDATGARVTFRVLEEIRNAATLPGGAKYDTLVVTEASEIASNVVFSNTVPNARMFYDAMVAGNANGRVFLYDSWDDSAGNIGGWVAKTKADHLWYQCVASAVNKDPARQRNPMLLLPAGVMMATVTEAIMARQVPGMDSPSALLSDDGHHASDVGNYLLAMTTYGALFGRAPELAAMPTNRFGRAYNLPAAATLTALRDLSWQTLTRFYQNGHHNRRPMAECRQMLLQHCANLPQSVCRDGLNRMFAD